jgi:hypothetical protein
LTEALKKSKGANGLRLLTDSVHRNDIANSRESCQDRASVQVHHRLTHPPLLTGRP